MKICQKVFQLFINHDGQMDRQICETDVQEYNYRASTDFVWRGPIKCSTDKKGTNFMTFSLLSWIGRTSFNRVYS